MKKQSYTKNAIELAGNYCEPSQLEDAIKEHAALVAVADAAKAAQAMARARGIHFDGLDSSLANLAAIRNQ